MDAEGELNAKFKQDVRSRGVDHALKEVHNFNDNTKAREVRARNNEMDSMAMETLDRLGIRARPSPRAGRRSVVSTATQDGVKGKREQVFYDGELVSEVFTPIE